MTWNYITKLSIAINMSFILSIETATPSCSVAIHHNSHLLASHAIHLDKSHSGLLTILIKDILRHCNLSMKDLSAVAISAGPGSYTGLRIGTSTAKGLAYSLQMPLIAVNTLEAMARQVPTFGTYYLCPMLDARRMEVYSMILDSQYSNVQPTEAVIVETNSYQTYLDKGKTIFFGNGAEKCIPVINHHNAIFLNGVIPSAINIGAIAVEKYNKEEFEDVAYYEPFYLKDFKPTKPKNS